MKQILLFFFLSFTIGAFSQELPEFIMPPEDAFQFTKYGDVPINESTGRINLNVPLLTYEVGSLQLPLSLSYVGNGVKVNQFPTRTGINWRLIAGGVITRIVKSFPDDPNQNYYLSPMDLNNMDIQNETIDTELLNILAEGETYDTERDEFNFSFPGYSGSFYLDDNFNPVVVDRSSNLKVQIEGTLNIDQKIIITSPDGTKYFFGGTEIGISKLRNNNGIQLTDPATTAYYLYKIKNIFGDTILFEYDEYGRQELSSLTQKIVYQTGESWDPSIANCPRPNFTNISPLVKNQVFNHSINKKLKRIYSNNTSDEVTLNDSSFGSLFQLNSIIHSSNSQTVNKIDLNYLEPNNGNNKRFFLEEVIDYNHLNSNLDDQKKVYKMEYNNPEDLPDQFSYSQDYYGYYNAKQNNTFVPKNDHYYFSIFNNNLADRSVDFNQAQKGSLKKIIYPTKGYTQFEYEAPQIKETSYENATLSIYHNDTQLIPENDYFSNHFTSESQNNNTIGVFGDQDVEFKIKIDLDPGYVEKHLKIKLTIQDVTNSTSSNHYFSLGTANNIISEPTTIIHDAEYNLIDGHEYVFSLTFSNTQYMDSSWARVRTKAFFKYANDETYVDGHGIRIKNTTAFTKENEVANYKRYYYKQAKNINTDIDESMFLNPNPPSSLNIYPGSTILVCMGPPSGVINPPCSLNFWTYDTLEYSSSQGNFPDSDNQSHYKFVTVSYGGDNFENGGVEKEYYISGGSTYNIITNPLLVQYGYIKPKNILSNSFGNSDFQNGKVLKEKLIGKYSSSNNELHFIKKTEYVYDYSSYQFLSNFVGDRHSSCLDFSDSQNLLLGSYSVSSYNNHLLQQKVTDYIDPLPIIEINDTGYEKVINTLDYQYGDLAGLPIETKITNSKGEQQIEKRYYPVQVNTASDLNLDPVLTVDEFNAINNLKSSNLHRVSTPIQIEFYVREGNDPEQLVSAQRTGYKTFSNGFTQTKSVQSSKNGSSFEDRIIYYEYDANGNPLELSKADGTRIVYKWDSNHKKPLAKIENATYSQVQNATGDLRIALPDALVTTYTYSSDPLHLLTSTTDARGYTMYYEYDSFNRLEHVKDDEGNILSKNEYNYANQN